MGSGRPQDVCVVVPVFNEATVIADVVGAVRRHYPTVVCVDDGSIDGSAEEITRAGAVLVRHTVNLGQGAALQTGVEMALRFPQVTYVVTFDADGQHDIDDAVKLLEPLREGVAQIVFGSRFLDRRTEVGRAKRVILAMAVRYTRATSGLRLTDTHNGFRAFTRDVAESFDIQMNGMAHASEIISMVAARKFAYAEAPVHIRYTDYSRSKGQPLMNAVNILFDLMFR